MSSFVRRSVAAAGTVLVASGATVALMLGGAGAANAATAAPTDGEFCSMSSACVKPTPEFNEAATDCIPPAAVGGAAGAATGGPGGAVVVQELSGPGSAGRSGPTG